MTDNPLKALTAAGQAIWLDYLHQDILKTGELRRLIADDGVTGLTSNPSIFEKAIGDGEAYDGRIARLIAAGVTETNALYEAIAIADIQGACDQFRPTWDRLQSRDGYASLEVSPELAHDTGGTVQEARRLWAAVDRPNLMIKVPGTPAGVPAIRQLIAEGINVNVTLLFALQAYLDVAEAHMAGLEDLRASGGDVAKVHGVASFFVSRIDTAIDKKIDEQLKTAGPAVAQRLKALRGQVAIANARVAYQRYLQMIETPRWRTLAEAGAAPQRLLWASPGPRTRPIRRPLRRDLDRSGHHQHHAAQDAGRLPRPRPRGPDPHRRPRAVWGDSAGDRGPGARPRWRHRRPHPRRRHPVRQGLRRPAPGPRRQAPPPERQDSRLVRPSDGAQPGDLNAAWHRGPGPNGRQYRAPADERRAQLRRLRPRSQGGADVTKDGATALGGLKDAATALTAPRTVWVMLPAGAPTDDTIAELAEILQPGDTIVDGGNTFYRDDIRRAKALKSRGVAYVDVGTSGGVWGLSRGYCMMVGGEPAVVERLEPVLKTLAPGAGDIPPTRRAKDADPRAVEGYIHAGPVGAGHFVKMVHNGIEYGLMQAYAEGFDILRNKNSEALPEDERYDLNLPDIAEVWRRGSVISSWLLDLTAQALAGDAKLEKYTGAVADSGEGRWTVQAAIEEAVPADVLAAALFARFRSREDHTFGEKLLSAMRFGFGGHVETTDGA